MKEFVALSPPSGMQTKTAQSSEVLVSYYITAWHNEPENHEFYHHCCEDLKSRIQHESYRNCNFVVHVEVYTRLRIFGFFVL